MITNLRLATWKGNDFPPRSTVLIPITSRPVKRTNFISDFSCETALAMDAESRRERVKALLRLPPEERHRVFLEDYDRFYGGGKDAARARASVLHAPVADDLSVVKSSFRFLRSDEDDDALSAWEARLARRYYDRLFREYCVADLSRCGERKVGLRWRTATEVKRGKGQFFCGEKRCDEGDDLASYEVHFAYVEAGERKEALVKLRACPRCARKLVDARGGDAPTKRGASGTENTEAETEAETTAARRGAERKRKRKKTTEEDAEDEDAQHRRCFTNMFA